MPTVLIIDDDQNLRQTLSDLVAGEGHSVSQATDGQQAIEILSKERPDVALCDWRMSPLGGLEVLQAMQKQDGIFRIPIIVLTAYGDAESTVQAMQAGAYDFLVKPVDVDSVLTTLNRAMEHVELQRHLDRLQMERFRDGRIAVSANSLSSEQLIGRSPAWIDAFKRVGQVAQTDLTVLVEGETGTGKEVVAKVIHRNSQRSKGPFIAVNCAAIPEDLVESELFGHERGSFTGAVSQRAGSFEQAEAGTLFLDEIGEMPSSVQPKLLRVLQEKMYQRVGGSRPIKADVRVIAATNRSLAQEVELGRFRSDLYYRLNAYQLVLPALRERRIDIVPLAEYFLERFALLNHSSISVLDASAKHALESYSFPGNVRELEQLMNKLAVEAGGRPIYESSLVDHLKPTLQRNTLDMRAWEDLPFHEATSRWERYLIERALTLTGGNKSDAARRLGIQRRLLYEKMQRFSD